MFVKLWVMDWNVPFRYARGILKQAPRGVNHPHPICRNAVPQLAGNVTNFLFRGVLRGLILRRSDPFPF